MADILKIDDSISLYREFQKIRLNIDRVNTPNLSRIKEIIKRIHFADIVNSQQVLDNKGDAYYKIYEKDEGDKFHNLTLSYTIEPKHTGVVYGQFKKEKDKNQNTKIVFSGASKADQFTNYARFLVDITSRKIVYSNELNHFIIVEKNTFKVLDETSFSLEYPVEKSKQIPDFLSVLEEIYREVIKVKTHDYKIYQYMFAGIDWLYDCKKLELIHRKPTDKELFVSFNQVSFSELDFQTVDNFLNLIADGEKSLNNLRLLHSYVLLRKLNLEPPEHFFILKDFGRTGKGLLMNTFDEAFKVNKVNFDSLTGGGFEANNEWFKFYDTDLAHANETGEIDKKNMRVLRKISTCEPVTGREIGKDSVKFNIRAVLILDTNEAVDIGEITANKARTVKISFKDRPQTETNIQRHEIFKPYWDFIQPNQKNSLSASLSFIIRSLDYLKIIGGKFIFDEVTLKNYFSISELTETQQILVIVIDRDGYIFSGDETLLKAIENDYGNLRFKKAKEDVKKIGVKLNQQKKIDGQNFKVHTIGDKELFNQVVVLINNDESEGY